MSKPRKLINFKNENTNKEAMVYRLPDTDEYLVKLFIDGKHYVPANYYTTDRDDAEGTALHMIDLRSSPKAFR